MGHLYVTDFFETHSRGLASADPWIIMQGSGTNYATVNSKKKSKNLETSLQIKLNSLERPSKGITCLNTSKIFLKHSNFHEQPKRNFQKRH